MDLIQTNFNKLTINDITNNSDNKEINNNWCSIDRLTFQTILAYIPKGRILQLGLVCKHWYSLSLSRLYSRVNLRKLNYFKRNFNDTSQKLKFTKEIDSSSFPKFTIEDLKLIKLCPNLKSIGLDSLLNMSKEEINEFLSYLPNLEDLSLICSSSINSLSSSEFIELINSASDKLEGLKRLQLVKVDCLNESKELLLNPKMLNNLLGFSLNPYRSFELNHLNPICNQMPNLKNFTLNLEHFFNASDLNELLGILQTLQNLEKLIIKFSTPNTEEYLFNPPIRSHIQISNFNFTKLKVFSLKYLASPRSFVSQFSVPEFDFELKFNYFCSRLTCLTLPRLDGSLLTQLSTQCPSLIELIMESSLPLPTPGFQPFLNLKRLCSTSFSLESTSSPSVMRSIFFKVNNFNLKSTYTNNNQLNFINQILPNLTTIAINGAIPNINELLSYPNLTKANWKHMYIFRFEYNPRKLLQLLDLITNRVSFITLIWSGYQSRGLNYSKLIYSQFPSIKVFTGFKNSEFDYLGIELIEN